MATVVYVNDPNGGSPLKINPDGSINVTAIVGSGGGTQGVSGIVSGIITQTVEPTYLGNFKACRVTAVSGGASGVTGLAGFSALSSVKSSIVKNPSTSQSVYIGESGITTSTGWKLGPGEALTFYNLNNLFVIADSGQSQEIMILQSA